MTDNGDEIEGDVHVTMEISGKYDDVVDRLDVSDHGRSDIAVVLEDFSHVLDTIDAIDGGTRSVIVENLPADVAIEYDTETVVNALQVLERYDLVTLEGNTWKIAR